jgi:hypothetical protein
MRVSGGSGILFVVFLDMDIRKIIIIIILACTFSSCEKDEEGKGVLELLHVFVGTTEINLSGSVSTDLPVDRSISLSFSSAINQTTASGAITLSENGQPVNADISFLSNGNTAVIFPSGSLKSKTTYTIGLSDQLKGTNGERFVPMEINFTTILGELKITSISIAGNNASTPDRLSNIPLTFTASVEFNSPVTESALSNAVALTGSGASTLVFSLSNGNKTAVITSTTSLRGLTRYQFTISNSLKGAAGEPFTPISKTFYTTVDNTPKFPVISDEELLTKVQQQTFKYFWDLAHPVSGMARERNTSGDIVTSGGSGFGLMAIIVGIERNFITRQQGIERLDKILDFLETADRFHGVWPHWINGSTGKVIPFSTKDNGGDLVETSFLVQGLLTFRQYLNAGNATEQALITRINSLWETVEWDWYRKNNENVLYWHWSPNYNWEMNFALSGYFEEQITYFLAAASPTHSIPKVVYTNGYGKNGAIVKNNTHYGYKLPLESPAPLFWVHYSYLGLDPHFTDDFANYWEQNVNATLINQAYCIANPKNFVGYSDECWGLTSSDNQSGYNAHSPGNDLGVITPTAALSSFPYTPEQSMKALKFFYYKIGDRLWGEYGFYDAFNLTEGWTANSYLAIDQGPIIVMIENHRTGLLWDLFMSAPEVQNGVTALSFIY